MFPEFDINYLVTISAHQYAGHFIKCRVSIYVFENGKYVCKTDNFQ